MKTKNKFSKISLTTGLAFALAIATCLSTAARAAEVVTKGGAGQLMRQIKTQADAEALQPGDSMAMVCTKCKSVSVIRVEKESKGHLTRMIPGEQHLCAGCGGHIEVVGHGKSKTDVRHHTCSKCGDDSAFCCATKPGTGSTRGMDKK